MCFLLVLLVVTLRSTSTPLELAADDRASAQRICQVAVRTRMTDARFPYDANVEARATGELYLSGSVDGGSPAQPVRRNYECLLRRGSSGSYLADSVRVWQSH
jgi:hypothetical protein